MVKVANSVQYLNSFSFPKMCNHVSLLALSSHVSPRQIEELLKVELFSFDLEVYPLASPLK